MTRTKIDADETRSTTLPLESGDTLFIARRGHLSIVGPDPAARIAGGNASIRNDGAIDSRGAAIVGTGATTIVNLAHGSILGQDGAGIAISEGTLTLANRSGSITSYAGTAVTVGGTIDLRNLGYGIIVGKLGVHASGGTIVNGEHALIEGRTLGIVIDDGAGGPTHNATHIVNHGTINAKIGTAILIVGDADDTVVNHGKIDCANTTIGIDTGAGNDRVVNTGVISNSVVLGDGDDVFRNSGTVYGLLNGGSGDDRIYAGPGNTRIVGGLGRDVLTGGAGSDRFEFSALAESGATLPTPDRITDFDKASGDVIILTLIDADSTAAGDQNFSNIGTNEFSGHAGELRVVAVGAGVAVYADTDGDKVADFALLLTGLTDPAATQFLL